VQHIYAGIVAFVIREWRSLVAIGVFMAIAYIWGKLSEKESYFQWLVKLNPKNAEAHYNLGNFLEKLPNRKEDAEKEYQQAIAIRPKYAWPYYDLYFLQANQGNFTEAQTTLKKCSYYFQKMGLRFPARQIIMGDRDYFKRQRPHLRSL
jgi:tetratricopeptide (TPR) repeat protein